MPSHASKPRSSDDKPRGKNPFRASRTDWVRFRRLLAFATPYRRRLILGLGAVLATSLLSLAAPITVRYLVDAIVPGGEPALLGITTLILVAIFLLQSGVKMVSSYQLAFVGERVVTDLRLDLYRHLHTLPLGFFNDRRSGELVSRLTNDVTTVRNLVTNNLATALSQTLVFFGALALIVVTDWRLTVFMLAIVPAVVVMGIFFGRGFRRLSKAVQDALASATAVLQESLGGIREVKSFRREEHEIGRYGESVEEAFDLAMRRSWLTAAFGPLISSLFFAGAVCILWFGGKAVLAGRLTPGQLVTFLVLTMMLAGAIGQFSGLWSGLQQALGASERLFDLLDTDTDLIESSNPREIGETAGGLAFEDVFFDYSARTHSDAGEDTPPAFGAGTFALRQISLEIRPGETVALVGPSGAGKTTLINLIPRFYDPTGGAVFLDGVDLRNLRRGDLRDQIGIVPQDVYLFSGTVRENLIYGRLEATDAEIEAASRAANAHDFISELPDGYQTRVGERGVKLSGGQRQRVAIARAILKDPRILLLDEATSALDSESESLVQGALRALMKDRTSVVIAHRLSTVRHADRVVVLDRGCLIEIGTHQELLAREGLYARHYLMQFRSPEDGEDPQLGQLAVAKEEGP